MNHKLFDYWNWFLKGSGGKAGYQRVVNWWSFLHLTIGIILALLVEDIAISAEKVLLPLAGILVGLSFAWAGNAQLLLQSKEIDKLSDYHDGGFVEYVFTFQTAILSILVTLCLWGIAGLGIFNDSWPTQENLWMYLAVKILLFSFASLTIRECWHVVMGAQWMLLTQRTINKHNKNQS